MRARTRIHPRRDKRRLTLLHPLFQPNPEAAAAAQRDGRRRDPDAIVVTVLSQYTLRNLNPRVSINKGRSALKLYSCSASISSLNRTHHGAEHRAAAAAEKTTNKGRSALKLVAGVCD